MSEPAPHSRLMHCKVCTLFAVYEVTRRDGEVRFYCRDHFRNIGPFQAVRRAA